MHSCPQGVASPISYAVGECWWSTVMDARGSAAEGLAVVAKQQAVQGLPVSCMADQQGALCRRIMIQ